jgi:GxxExxY protein
MDIEETATQIVDAAMCVHKAVGPGLLESAYEAMLAFELRDRGLHTDRQVYLGLRYRQMLIKKAYCMDMLVNDCVVVEVKSVERLAPVFKKQVLTYLKLANLNVGFLINFGHNTLKGGGIHRIVNHYSRPDEAQRPYQSRDLKERDDLEKSRSPRVRGQLRDSGDLQNSQCL